ncbi:hypothetical protein GCM10020220_103800 [Nonomuraea rubra]
MHVGQRQVDDLPIQQPGLLVNGRADERVPEANGPLVQRDQAEVNRRGQVGQQQLGPGDGAGRRQGLAQIVAVVGGAGQQQHPGTPRQFRQPGGEGALQPGRERQELT